MRMKRMEKFVNFSLKIKVCFLFLFCLATRVKKHYADDDVDELKLFDDFNLRNGMNWHSQQAAAPALRAK